MADVGDLWHIFWENGPNEGGEMAFKSHCSDLQ